MINIKASIEDPSLLNEETLVGLKDLVEKYPFFQTARLLYLANLYKLHSKEFGPELRRASVFVPDRTALFALTEGAHYELPTTASNDNSIETESDGNRTLSLINSFLTTSSIETDDENDTERTTPTVADLTNDYASFLMQQDVRETKKSGDADRAKTDVPKLKGADLIDTFIAETQGKQRLEMPEVDDSEFVSPEFSVEDEEIYTESMVNIYIKQGRYQQALEILRKICLNNPKKSSNFAAQINLLEIIINGKSQ